MERVRSGREGEGGEAEEGERERERGQGRERESSSQHGARDGMSMLSLRPQSCQPECASASSHDVTQVQRILLLYKHITSAPVSRNYNSHSKNPRVENVEGFPSRGRNPPFKTLGFPRSYHVNWACTDALLHLRNVHKMNSWVDGWVIDIGISSSGP